MGHNAVLVLPFQMNGGITAAIGADSEFAVFRKTVLLLSQGVVQVIVIVERGDQISTVVTMGVRGEHTLNSAFYHSILPIINYVFFFMS